MSASSRNAPRMQQAPEETVANNQRSWNSTDSASPEFQLFSG